MIDAQTFAFIVVAGILTVTPGADTMLVVRNVLRGGRQDGIATSIGVSCGLLVHATFSALGISVILAHSAMAFSVVKFIGAGYLVWLGIQSLRSAFTQYGQDGFAKDPEQAKTSSFRASFLEGLLTNVLNPKVAIFYLAFLPQFIAPIDPVFKTSLLLASIHWAMGISWLLILSVLFGHTRQFLLRTSVRRLLDGLCGTILTGLGIGLSLEE